jgi:hypothetical protein
MYGPDRWNEHEKHTKKPVTVVYGHDAGRVKKWFVDSLISGIAA